MTETPKAISVVHLQPIEQYPPVMNLLRHFGTKGVFVTVHTTSTQLSGPNFEAKHVNVIRHGSRLIPKRLRFAFANLYAAIELLKSCPNYLLYYDPFSAFPTAIASIIFGQDLRVYHHSHEYCSPEWFRKSTLTLRFLHWLERRTLYAKSKFISHTNWTRVSLFLEDNPEVPVEKMRVFPNYPPRQWDLPRPEKKRHLQSPIRFVYIGVVSLGYTYIREICEWVAKNECCASLDIYTRNCGAAEVEFLSSQDASNINVELDGINYECIPSILSNFDVGLMLYKALTDNFKYNETNKFFEYLSADLDVLYPEEMLGVHPHETIDTYPIVRRLNFESITLRKVRGMLDRKGLKFVSKRRFSEDVYQEMAREIFE